MSVHIYTAKSNKGNVVVKTGWDRPTQSYFMTISPEDDPYVPLFSNLFRSDAFPKDFNAYRKVLEDYAIVLPEKMMEQVALDKEQNIGNMFKNWN